MNLRSTKLLLRILIAAAIALTVTRPGLAVNLVYFYGGTSSAHALYDYDTNREKSKFRTTLPSSLHRVNSLDIRPSDGTLFGLDSSQTPTRLIQLDPNTGQPTYIGASPNCTSLSFQPGTSTLFGVMFESGTFQRSLVTINTTNGNVTPIGVLPFSGSGVCVIEFFGDGSLVLFENMEDPLCFMCGRLYMVNPTNAQVTLMGVVNPSVSGLRDFAHVGNRLFAISGTGLWEIDVATRQATALDPDSLPFSAIASGGVVALLPIPKLTIAVASVSLQWPSVTGKTYQLQYQSPRTTNLWTNLGMPIPGTDDVLTVIDSMSDDPLRVYRLQSSP